MNEEIKARLAEKLGRKPSRIKMNKPDAKGWQAFRDALRKPSLIGMFIPMVSHADNLPQFVQLANFCGYWREMGDDLLVASDLLMDPQTRTRFPWLGDRAVTHLLRVVLMLRGMAVECYLKARFLAEGGKLYGPNGRFNKKALKADAHNVAQMADKLGLRKVFTADEWSILELLSEYSIAGRFPAHLEYKRTVALKNRSTWWGAEQETAFQALVEKICFPRLFTDALCDGETTARAGKRGVDMHPADHRREVDWRH